MQSAAKHLACSSKIKRQRLIPHARCFAALCMTFYFVPPPYQNFTYSAVIISSVSTMSTSVEGLTLNQLES